jgi:hypothetical protein
VTGPTPAPTTPDEARDHILAIFCAAQRGRSEPVSLSGADLHNRITITPALLSETVNRLIADGYLALVPDTQPPRVQLAGAGLAWCDRPPAGRATPS